MADMITIIGIDSEGTVRWVRATPPGRVVSDRTIGWIAELPAGTPAPAQGCRLRVMPILGRWPEP